MIMADVFKILFLILGMLICTVSYWLLFASLFPEAVARTQKAVTTRPYRVFGTGLLVGIPLALLSMGMASQAAGPLKLMGIFLGMVIVLAALFGSTGLIRQVGIGLASGGTHQHNGALTLRGGAVVSIACVLPIVGWFLIIPIVLITGFGAALRTLWRRRPVSVTHPATAGAAQA